MICAEEKNLLDCFRYTIKCIEKTLNGRNGFLLDQVVYDFSMEYYLNAQEEFLIEDKRSMENKQMIEFKYESKPVQRNYHNSDDSEQKSLF